MAEERAGFFHDWNAAEVDALPAHPVELDDETLRDGLQSPSVSIPGVEARVEFLHILSRLGVQCLDIGLPAAGPKAEGVALSLAREIAKGRLPLRPNCAARTLRSDVEAVARVSDAAGIAIEVAAFAGCSPVRQEAEGWDLPFLLRNVAEAVSTAKRAGLPVMFVAEDGTRARPEALSALFRAALDAGASRLCIADTAGFITPWGVARIVAFTSDVIRGAGVRDVGLDWHGHMDRGLGLANALAAVKAGVRRVHATGLGVGERSGNVPMELLLVNLKLEGLWRGDLQPLADYVRWVSKNLGVAVPSGHPVFGRDAYRTGTGVHAAAIYKALARGDQHVADSVYSSVPASWFGMEQIVEIGPMSGEASVSFWLWKRGIQRDEGLVRRVLDLAKAADRPFSDEEVWAEVSRWLGEGCA